MSSEVTMALPSSCGIAFKEWEGVCHALAHGTQSLILRKGGIEEGPGGFVPEHDAFWLYPTRVHQAEQGLKPRLLKPREPEETPPEGSIGLRALALVAVIHRVDRLEALEELDDLHVWTWETVEKRFHYRKPGLWVLGVRVFRRDLALTVPITPDHAGCKTWVPLESDPSTAGLTPALVSADFEMRMEQIRSVLGPSKRS